MVKFVCIGYDIRSWPPENHITTDATEWERVDAVFDYAIKITNSYKNVMQLIEADTDYKLDALVHIVNSREDCVLVALEIPELVFDAYRMKGNINPLGSHDWLTIGYDVSDIDGFFSIVHMGQPMIRKRGLFREDELMDAFVVSQAANLLVPSHSPFVVFRLRILFRPEPVNPTVSRLNFTA